MREFRHETIIIKKEAWQFLKNKSLTERGYKPLSQERLDKAWNRDDMKNNGANSKTHPIAENEIRIDPDCFAIPWDRLKSLLKDNGFEMRTDGFVAEGFYL